MAVCNEKLFGNHGVADLLGCSGISDSPQAVPGAEIVFDFYIGSVTGDAFLEDAIDDQPVVRVEHEDHVLVAFGGPHQTEAVHLGLIQSPLVRKNPARNMLQIEQRDESPLPLSLALDFVVLPVGINGGSGFLTQYALRDPPAENAARAGIVRLGIRVLLLASRYAHNAVGRSSVIFLLQLLRYLVVGLSHHQAEIADDLLVVSIPSERTNESHSCLPRPNRPR